MEKNIDNLSNTIFNRFLFDTEGLVIEEDTKQNASYQDFKTSTKLDSEISDILESIKPIVLDSIKKTKYFKKDAKQNV